LGGEERFVGLTSLLDPGDFLSRSGLWV